MTDCQQSLIRDRLPEFVHGTLGPVERSEIQVHLATCAACRDEVALLRTVRAVLLRRTPAVDAERIAAAVAAARVMPKTRPETSRMRRPVPQHVWRAAAAALLVIATGTAGYLLGRLRGPAPSTTATQTYQRPLTVQPVPQPSTPPRVGVVPAPKPAPQAVQGPAGISFGDGVADLSAAQISSLLSDLDRLAPVLDDEPEPDFDLGNSI